MSLDYLLSPHSLMDMVRQRGPLVDFGPFTKLFMKGKRPKIEAGGKRVVFEKRLASNQLGGVGTIGSEPFRNAKINRKLVEQGFIHVSASDKFGPEELFEQVGIGELGSTDPDPEGFLAERLVEIMESVYLTVEYICSQLATNASGVSLVPGNTALPTGACKINQTVTIDGGLSTVAQTAKWNLSSTKIFSDVTNTQFVAALRAMEAAGYRPFQLIHNRTVAAAILGNTEAAQFLTANGGKTIDWFKAALNAAAAGVTEGMDEFGPNELSGLGGVAQWNTWDHGYRNRSSAYARFMPDTAALLLPREIDKVLGFAEGISAIPDGPDVYGVGAGSGSGASLIKAARGMTAFAIREGGSTPKIELVVKYSFAPIVRDELGLQLITNVT